MAVDLDGSEKIYVSGLLFWQVIKNIEPSGDEIKRDDKGDLSHLLPRLLTLAMNVTIRKT